MPIAQMSSTSFIVASSILNGITILFTIFLLFMYLFMRRRMDAGRVFFLLIPTFLFLFAPQLIWAIWSALHPEQINAHLTGTAGFAPTMGLDLFYNSAFAFALALFVSSNSSRLFGAKLRHVIFLNIYVVMQVLYAIHANLTYSGKWMVGAIAFFAVGAFKVILFGLVQSQLTSGRMLFYIDKMKEVDEETEEEWTKFARDHGLQSVAT
jgi:hypothetical protein